MEQLEKLSVTKEVKGIQSCVIVQVNDILSQLPAMDEAPLRVNCTFLNDRADAMVQDFCHLFVVSLFQCEWPSVQWVPEHHGRSMPINLGLRFFIQKRNKA